MSMFSSTTNSEVPPLVIQLVVGLLAFGRVTRAATAMCVPGWDWANNSGGQNPCQVAGYLQAPCMGYKTYELGPLKPGSVYTIPAKNDTRGLKCDCNTVIYSLYSACEACQNASTRAWGQWNQNCDAVYVAQYPFDIPAVTAIPRWAFINFTEEGNFDVVAAQNVGRDPETVGNIPVTLNLSSTSSSRGLSTSTTPSHLSSAVSSSSPLPLSTNGSDLNGSTSNRNTVPAIVGGVIGGAVCLASISLLLVWLFLRHRSNGKNPYAAAGPLSHRSVSVRSRGSYYPPSVPVYNYEPETDKGDWQIPVVYGRSNIPPAQESAYSPTESDVQTTYHSPLYPSGRERNAPLEF